MRHFFAQTGAGAALAGGVGLAPRLSLLIAPTGRPYRSTPGRPRTGRPAIALAAVTVAANEKLKPATGAVGKTRQWQFHGDLRQAAEGSPGRRPRHGGYWRCNRARHGWGAAPERIWRSGAGAAPAPSTTPFLPLPLPCVSQLPLLGSPHRGASPSPCVLRQISAGFRHHSQSMETLRRYGPAA
jgi:hypothetical protein